MRARRRTHRRARRQRGLEEDRRQQEMNVTVVGTFSGRWCQRTSAAQRAGGSIGTTRGTSTVVSDPSFETLAVEEFLIVATVMHTRAQRAEDVMWLILVTTVADEAQEELERLVRLRPMASLSAFWYIMMSFEIAFRWRTLPRRSSTTTTTTTTSCLLSTRRS